VYVGKALDISGRRPRETQFLGACSTLPWTAAVTTNQAQRYLDVRLHQETSREKKTESSGIISAGDAGERASCSCSCSLRSTESSQNRARIITARRLGLKDRYVYFDYECFPRIRKTWMLSGQSNLLSRDDIVEISFMLAN